MLSWGAFDLANQSFTLVINTLLFGIFVKEVVMAGEKTGDFVWSLMGSISLGVVAICGPILGALADARGWKKRLLIGTGIFCAILTACLYFLPSGAEAGIPLAVTLAFLIYVPANIAYSFGENFLASFLPEISDRKTMGRVSAIGWTMGYLGALLLLIALVVATTVFGINASSQFRPLLLFAGIWFAIMIVPTALFLPERAPAENSRSAHPMRDALRQFGRTVRETSRFRDLASLFVSFFIYGMGVQVIIFFAGMIARGDFEFTTQQLFIFSVVVTLFAGVSAFGTGMIQDRIGHKATLLGFLALWTVVSGGLMLLAHIRLSAADPSSVPVWPVWAVGAGIGLGLGGIGTATRASVGVLTPSHRTAEFFGLWGTTYKLAGVVGLPLFGLVRSTVGKVPSLGVLTAFFVVGGLLVWRLIDMQRGSRTAEQEEDHHAVSLKDVAVAAGSEPMGTSALVAQLPDPADLDHIEQSSQDD